jgi:oxygen-independent coproporphyrinogen-3 oxidase
MNRNKNKPISSMYIHFPYCKHLCNFCDFYKLKITTLDSEIESADSSKFQFYHQYLSDQMDNLRVKFQQFGFAINEINLETLYIGGGTPSLWGKEGANFLRDFFKKNNISLDFQLNNSLNSGERTLEIDPGAFSVEGLKSWIDFGINRFSIGIQTLDENIFPLMDRSYSLKTARSSLDIIFHEFKGINKSIDFMMGLPMKNQSYRRNIIKELDIILNYQPQHISFYFLTVGNQYPLKKMIPQDDLLREEYLLVCDHLKKHGYNHYEVSNFALPQYESIHNKKYWNLESMLALGPSATGFLNLIEEEILDGTLAVANGKNSAVRFKGNYFTQVQKSEQKDFYNWEFLGQEELLIERVYLSLRTKKGLCPKELFSLNDQDSYQILCGDWLTKGYLLEVSDGAKNYWDHTVLSDLGLIMLDSLMGDLFRELKHTW